ncbi:hypothetical protein EDB84DRAFT_1573046 [Lactarius hengduanensis]|nr:hypothetical protein EDB84DRAFT_1573046 [Lactarius hengduanensis]
MAITGKMELESRAWASVLVSSSLNSLLSPSLLAHIPGPFCNVDIHTHPSSLQGPGLPPSNAVLPHPVPGGPPLPANYHQFRRGLSTFLFRLPLSPSSLRHIHFGDGLA